MAPGARALEFASRWFEPAIVHRTFEPLIADWQREWHDSKPSHRPWVSLRASAAFVCATVISSPAVLTTPTPRTISTSVARRIAVFCVIVGGALCIPMVGSISGREFDAPFWPGVVLVAMPAALAIAFPFSMISAVDPIRHGAHIPPHVERAAALKLGLIAVLFMMSVGGLLAPLASQKWLELSTPSGWNIPQPRIQQLSTPALLTHPDRFTAIVPAWQYSRANEIRRELVQRVVISAMPAIFIWLRWSTLSSPRRRRWWPLPAALMTALVMMVYFVSLFAGFRLELALQLSPGAGRWLPVVIFGLWACAVSRRHIAPAAAAY